MIQYLNIVVIPTYFLSPSEISLYSWRSMLRFLFFGMNLKCRFFLFVCLIVLYIYVYGKASIVPLLLSYIYLFYLICDAIYVFFHFFDYCEKGQEESLLSSYNTRVWINSWRVSLFLTYWVNYTCIPEWTMCNQCVAGAQGVTPECHLWGNNLAHNIFYNWNFAFYIVLMHEQL